MFKLPSAQRDFTLCSSMDDAVDLHVPELGSDPTDEDRKAHADALKAAQHKYRVAQQTGDWMSIVKPGMTPTVFRFAQVHKHLNWIAGERDRKKLSENEVYELTFRVAIREISNFGGWKYEFETVGNMQFANDKCMEPLYSIGREDGKPFLGQLIIRELGAQVLERAVQGVSPLS